MIGLYDHQGVLRFAGPSAADCLSYAELFALAADSYTLESLEKVDVRAASHAGARAGAPALLP